MICDLCKSPNLNAVLDLGHQPLANKYPRQDQFETEMRFPLTVMFCESCRNVQLSEKVSRELMFEDYFYLSSVNLGLVRHFTDLAQQLKGSKFVVDVGSNDGVLLAPLKSQGISCLGVEPSINVSKIANDNGLDTLCSFFDAAAVKHIAEKHGAPDVIIASSVFTHLDDPHTFLDDAHGLLSEYGRLIIEVEYIANILKKLQFERFYLDRIYYYSLTSLAKLFELHGFKITKVEMIEPHGGSLRVIAHKLSTSIAVEPSVKKLLQDEQQSLTLKIFEQFRKDITVQMKALHDLLQGFKDEGVAVAGYGAPARVSTICNFAKIGPDLVPFTVDDSPLKQGRFTPELIFRSFHAKH